MRLVAGLAVAVAALWPAPAAADAPAIPAQALSERDTARLTSSRGALPAIDAAQARWCESQLDDDDLDTTATFAALGVERPVRIIRASAARDESPSPTRRVYEIAPKTSPPRAS